MLVSVANILGRKFLDIPVPGLVDWMDPGEEGPCRIQTSARLISHRCGQGQGLVLKIHHPQQFFHLGAYLFV